jgi:hypothetical protein
VTTRREREQRIVGELEARGMLPSPARRAEIRAEAEEVARRVTRRRRTSGAQAVVTLLEQRERELGDGLRYGEYGLERGGLVARRQGDDIPECLSHVTSVCTSVAVATGASCTEHQVREKLRRGELFEDWEDSPAVLRSTARRVRAELIAEIRERHIEGIKRNGEVDKQKRADRLAAAEAGRKNHEASFIGTRVSSPGAAPEPWMDLPSEGDE